MTKDIITICFFFLIDLNSIPLDLMEKLHCFCCSPCICLQLDRELYQLNFSDKSKLLLNCDQNPFSYAYYLVKIHRL